MKKYRFFISGSILIGVACFFIFRNHVDMRRLSSVTGVVVEVSGTVQVGEELVVFDEEEGFGRFSISVEQSSDFGVGDKITVYYEGSIIETYPAEFQHVIRIEKEIQK
ncbi:TPA: hypothetical protein QFT53_000264 [Enterococcus faecium]